ncbi:hypothetical protein ACFV23_55520 [Streptomyces sp. NPDC059627]
MSQNVTAPTDNALRRRGERSKPGAGPLRSSSGRACSDRGLRHRRRRSPDRRTDPAPATAAGETAEKAGHPGTGITAYDYAHLLRQMPQATRTYGLAYAIGAAWLMTAIHPAVVAALTALAAGATVLVALFVTLARMMRINEGDAMVNMVRARLGR